LSSRWPVGDLSSRRPNRGRRPLIVAASVTILLAVVIVRVEQSPPPLRVAAPARSAVIPGTIAELPWPTLGQAAASVPAVRFAAARRSDRAAPIASLAKVMTALVVLRAHPLKADEQGPPITITQTEVDEYTAGIGANRSEVAVTVGEKLSERQALEALLIGSANNIAGALAEWTSKSTAAFVKTMNDTAAELHMASTHYTDPSGFEDATVSTAADQVRLAEVAMADATFAAIVAEREATIPVAGTVKNYNRFVGTNGLVGVKTGSTSAAGGCFIAAVRTSVGGRDVLAFAAVLGLPGPDLITAGLTTGSALARAAAALPVDAVVVPRGSVVGEITSAWGPHTKLRTVADVHALGLPGAKVHVEVRPRAGLRAGAGGVVGAAVVVGATPLSPVRVKADARIGGPSVFWRLLHG
jgi:D-alanyl-D-alanine carboxypeptidase (penicillin-binding protein 5/6)